MEVQVAKVDDGDGSGRSLDLGLGESDELWQEE